MTSGKRNPPFGLDMPFPEALERYAGVNPAELAKRPRSVPEAKGPQVLTWWKKLSLTDAQRETTGSKVPYLRLTKASLEGEDFQTWFREKFFDGAAWSPGQFGKEECEIATVPFAVTIKDMNVGNEAMTVSHGEDRQASHNAPATWIHWSPKLLQLLELNDFSGRPVRITRDDHGAFHLDIDASADAHLV